MIINNAAIILIRDTILQGPVKNLHHAGIRVTGP